MPGTDASNARENVRIEPGFVSYGSRLVLQVPGLIIDGGQAAIVRGNNGSGKTSFLHSLCALKPVYSGSMFVGTDKLDGLGPERRAQLGVRLVPQGRRVFQRLSVTEHGLLASRSLAGTHAVSADVPFEAGLPGSQRGIALSGGQARRVALAALTLGQVRFLMLDEPFAGLDESGAAEVVERITRQLERGAACLITDHSGRAAATFPAARLYAARPQVGAAPFELAGAGQ